MFADLRSVLSTLLPRMSGWLFIVLLLMVAVWLLAPHQLMVSLYKLSLVTLAAVVGYWLDRSLFPYARPHEFLSKVKQLEKPPEAQGPLQTIGMLEVLEDTKDFAMNCMLRRAIIVGAAMIAVGLGA